MLIQNNDMFQIFKNQNIFPDHICRTAFCPDCAERKMPQKGDSFVTFRGTGKNYRKHTCDRIIAPSHFGFTPHVFIYKDTIDMSTYSKVLFKQICLMDGCGISVQKKENGELALNFLKEPKFADYISLTYESALGLVNEFRNSGYELDWDYSSVHTGAVLAPSYNYLELRRLYRDKERHLQVFAVR